MKDLWEVGEFVRRIRARMRFGELSRAPIRLLRLELRGDIAQCDWLARPQDVWAGTLPRHVRDRDASLQALQDAVALREMLFAALPEVQSADFRTFRQEAREPPVLIINGTVTREMPSVPRVTSPVMKAKLCGFHFQMDDGVLEPLAMEDGGVQFKVSA
jgi:hypothetical protein